MDPFTTHHTTLTAPAQEGESVTPSDSQSLARVSRAIYVGTGGDLRLRLVSGSEITLANAQPGALYPVRAAQILATGTTAGGLVALS